jgi:hypothetical protein
MDDLELEKYVDIVFKTPFGAIMRMKNGAAIVLRDNRAEVISSLENYHIKYKDDTRTWTQLTSDEDKRQVYAANAAALSEIKWRDVETALEAARNLEAAAKRKSLIDSLVDLPKEIFGAIIVFPLVILILWTATFGANYYFGIQQSHLLNGAIGGLAAGIFGRYIKNPGRVVIIAGVLGYLVCGLVFWKFG